MIVPGNIKRFGTCAALSSVLIAMIPLEELVFDLTFGMYRTGVYKHFTWTIL